MSIQSLCGQFWQLSPADRQEFIRSIGSKADSDLFGEFWNALPIGERRPFLQPLFQHVISILRPMLIKNTAKVMQQFPNLTLDEYVEPVTAEHHRSVAELEEGLVLREEHKFKSQRDAKPRHTQRDAEIVRLHDEEGKSFGEIALSLSRNGAQLSSRAAQQAYRRQKRKVTD